MKTKLSMVMALLMAAVAVGQITVTNVSTNVTQVTLQNSWMIRPDAFSELFWSRTPTGPWTNAAPWQVGYTLHEQVFRFTNEPSAYFKPQFSPIVWPAGK